MTNPNPTPFPTSERQPPFAFEAERAVIGCALVDPKTLSVLSKLDQSEFFIPAHRTAWEVICLLNDRGDTVDVITVGNEIRGQGLWETFEGGWTTWALQVANEVVSTSNAGWHMGIVKSKSVLRSMIEYGAEMQARAYNNANSDELVADARNHLSEIEIDAAADTESRRVGDFIGDTIQKIAEKSDPQKRNALIMTGIASFDAKTGGLGADEVVVVAARPGQGKTSYVNGVLLHATDNGVPGLLFSVEMSEQQEHERFLSMETGIPASHLRSGRDADGNPLDLCAHKLLVDGGVKLHPRTLWINDKASTLGSIIAESRRWYAKEVTAKGFPIGLIVVDYLQLVDIESRGKFDNREQQVARLSKALKKLAKALHCAIIIVCQLNRDVEKRGGDPRLSDLRESGAIEQDADMILFTVRDTNSAEASDVNDDCPARIVVGKNRHGPIGNYPAWWKGQTMRFVSRDAGGYVPRETSNPPHFQDKD
jgi:replicative DNA helicase